MGQRLVIHMLNKDETEIANAYYHWSGYTTTIYEMAISILQGYNRYIKNNDYPLLKQALFILSGTGAGFLSKDKILSDEEFKNLTENNIKIEELPAIPSRNDGIISIDKKGIAESNYWAEGDIFIHLENHSISISSLYICEYETEDELNLEEPNAVEFDKKNIEYLGLMGDNISDITTLCNYLTVFDMTSEHDFNRLTNIFDCLTKIELNGKDCFPFNAKIKLGDGHYASIRRCD